ncbi:1,3-beta-glucanosyltransferase [Komagataella phaffii CBS 7435]|uniref:1,3-beta-glucanosyltransferase n=2 Tax=Komagataella phaffii TaxID=460519 RepID=C4R3S8_KOMPG|nr:1,3-beta-glucanosyltransferase [Komagataella phaffii GS115]AOA68286.1 GQ68_03193T1 [Komagataella phaffii GS115]CAH2450057.1 1,3-beta-glucanosyltransferase [Komagataella phaffii CBS 7435]CAY70162.1 1,3-beta-glucanosyltransferase [Komagataella phaffii GS115]CCA39991.1 1,3-beta-glucanosyltransferase [Komagataella phaffii CBS 7435]
MLYLVTVLLFLVHVVLGYIHPITIKGKHFYDSLTGELFMVKGVDYQPGGASGVSTDKDPLSEIEECARDILLFQELGINTIRVYSVNPDLNHDKCMSLLASAGIYLILDVNSPLPNQSINRYEPWSSYNHDYLYHIFKVVEQFSHYNNTLAFFAGNEVVNDKVSATHSSNYMKAVVRDLKTYITHHSDRPIPVGYSAADDLSFRIPLAKYLECSNSTAELDSVDFYGVNSYQWCGYQNMQTSGYDQLVAHYADYTKPIMFSEYGCNEVTPRIFQEVEAIYSSKMSSVFNGGLAYEFAQEPNNYGMVEYLSDGRVKLLKDFETFKNQLAKASETYHIKQMNENVRSAPLKCQGTYENLGDKLVVPQSLGMAFITQGVKGEKGSYVELSDDDFVVKKEIFLSDGTKFQKSKIVATHNLNGPDTQQTVPEKSQGSKNGQITNPNPKPKPQTRKIPNKKTKPKQNKQEKSKVQKQIAREKKIRAIRQRQQEWNFKV